MIFSPKNENSESQSENSKKLDEQLSRYPEAQKFSGNGSDLVSLESALALFKTGAGLAGSKPYHWTNNILLLAVILVALGSAAVGCILVLPASNDKLAKDRYEMGKLLLVGSLTTLSGMYMGSKTKN
jgi:hypothetical protein